MKRIKLAFFGIFAAASIAAAGSIKTDAAPLEYPQLSDYTWFNHTDFKTCAKVYRIAEAVHKNDFTGFFCAGKCTNRGNTCYK